jgi:hypothetical protein
MAGNRSVPLEAEIRLRESLSRGAWVEVEPNLPPRPRALGRLIALLSSELVAHSPAGEAHSYLQHGTIRMLERLSGKELPGPEHPAETIADYWWLRLNNAQERTHEQGVAAPVTGEQGALMEIQAALGIEPSGATKQRRNKLERK